MKNWIIVFLLLCIAESHAQDYLKIDQRIESLPNKEYVSIEALYHDVVLPAYSEAEKVRALAMWVVHNIAYDVEYKHSKTPLETLNRRKGVCQSYAEFFKALCDMAGIECRVISGHGRNHSSLIGMPVRSDHAWNAVKIDGKFHLFDLTWAAGHLGMFEFIRDYNSRYYMTPPEHFVLDHYPDDPEWQLLERTVSREEYSAKPYVEKAYFKLNISDLKPSSGIIRSDTVRITFQSDREITEATVYRFSLSEYGSAAGHDMSIKRSGKEYTLSYVEKQPGAYDYSIYLNGVSAFHYKVATPNYRPAPPVKWDLNDPHSLIEPYHYVFHAFDQKLFAQLNPGCALKPFNDIPLANDLCKSLADWYGDIERYYVQGPGEIVTIKVEGFSVVLQKVDKGWVFKEIKRKA